MPGCLPLARPSCSWPFLVLSVPAIAAPSAATNTDQPSLPSVPPTILSLDLHHGVCALLYPLEQPHDHVRAFHPLQIRVVYHPGRSLDPIISVQEAVHLAARR